MSARKNERRAEGRYPVPGATIRVEGEVKRSRFITTLGPAITTEEARAFVEDVRAEFGEASHNCWAFLIGPPGFTGNAGMSDDGEPHNTAGRPMLDVLVHSGLGDVAVVVTRFFGGTKLGRGGLVRAYSGSVQQALSAVPKGERVQEAFVSVRLAYPSVTGFRRMLPEFGAELLSEAYEEMAGFELKLPESRVRSFEAALQELTSGQASLKRRVGGNP